MIETVLANGHTRFLRRPDGLLIELMRLRAVCRRQKAAIEQLGEDVAMYRSAATALTVQNIALREAVAASGGQSSHTRPGNRVVTS